MLSNFLANGRNVKKGVDKSGGKRYYATIQGGHAIENRGKEKISDEEAERDDDVYGDVHVQHVHVLHDNFSECAFHHSIVFIVNEV